MNILPARPATEVPCSDTEQHPPKHPPGGFHVLKQNTSGYHPVDRKRLAAWDPAGEIAWWEHRDAARMWAKREFPGKKTIVVACADWPECPLLHVRRKPRPVKVSLAELRTATGMEGGKQSILAAIRAAFGQPEERR